jgi:hypothetical protein
MAGPWDEYKSEKPSASAGPWSEYSKETPKKEGEPDLYTRTYEALSGAIDKAIPEGGRRQQVVGPMLAAGAGELIRGGGAVTQLAFPETGKKISDVGRAVVEATKSRYPILGTIGEFGSYVYPYKAAEAAVGKVLPEAVNIGQRAMQAGAAAGLTGAATTEGNLIDRAFAGGVGLAGGIGLTYGGALASKGYDWTKNTLKQAFGGDARRLSEALRDYSSRLSGKEAQTAQRMAADIEQEAAARGKKSEAEIRQAKQTAGIAETAEQKAARQQELALRELPGTKTEMEAGRFKPIPTSEQAIGDRIRGYVDKVFTDLKAARSKNAEKLKQEAFGLAAAREQQGMMPKDTEAFKKGMAELNQMIKTATLSDINAPLQRVRNALDPVKEVEGVIVGKPVTFEGLEQLRRFLRDRSYGLPAEGFDAIGQQQAGKLADIVESIQREFTTGYPSLTAAARGEKSSAFDRFLEQYKKDSEPLRVFKTKTGKLFEEQLPGVKGYAKVPSENIPSRVFKDRESYQGLIEALGGNKAFAENEARKYFVGEMEKFGGDPKKLEAFIRDNRTMLNLTNAREMAESYIARASAMGRRAGAAAARSEQELQRVKDIEAVTKQEGAAATREANRLKDLGTEFSRFESQIKAARTPDEIARLHDSLATRLFREGKINQTQYDQMLNQGREVLQSVSDKDKAIKNLLSLSWRSVGGGLIGAGVYGGVRYMGNQ